MRSTPSGSELTGEVLLERGMGDMRVDLIRLDMPRARPLFCGAVATRLGGPTAVHTVADAS